MILMGEFAITEFHQRPVGL